MQPLVFLSVLDQGNDHTGQLAAKNLLQGKLLSAQIEHLLVSKNLNDRWRAVKTLKMNALNSSTEEVLQLLNIALKNCNDPQLCRQCVNILQLLMRGSQPKYFSDVPMLNRVFDIGGLICRYWCGMSPWQIKRKLAKSNTLKFNLEDLSVSHQVSVETRSIILRIRNDLY